MNNSTRTAAGLRRAADALLRGSGARSIFLRVPANAVPADVTEQLGLAVPLFQDMELSPVVFRTAAATLAENKANRRELIVSATAIETLTGSHDYGSAKALFASAFGVLIDEVLLTIAGVSELEAGGLIYAYRLELRETLAEAI